VSKPIRNPQVFQRERDKREHLAVDVAEKDWRKNNYDRDGSGWDGEPRKCRDGVITHWDDEGYDDVPPLGEPPDYVRKSWWAN